MNQDELQHQTLRVLEWERLLEFLASQAHSTMGKERCLNLTLEPELESSQRRMQETSEMRAIEESDRPFPTLFFQDLRGALRKGEKGGILEAHEFRDISNLLGLAGQVLLVLVHHQEQAIYLWNFSKSLQDLSLLKTEIDQCIDPEGNIQETATPTLHQWIQAAHHLRHRIRQRLEGILSSHQYEDVLQEKYFAQRQGRYVLPIKADFQSSMPGIVHDVSASGATVFLEPRELVDLNNELKVAEVQVNLEVQRILQDLSGSVAYHGESVAHHLDVLGYLDCVGAKARLSELIQGNPLTLNGQGRIRLTKACHPLLVLAHIQVIPNNIVLEEHDRVLVISGPNTGGKTVTLKLIGLFALMVRVGLHPSCQEGSEMAFFKDIFADIGDAQDLTKDLSSFSAHILNIIHLLKIASRTPASSYPTTLVMLDEVIGSTDPSEGAALATALLQKFVSLGFKAVVTTHYHSLKTLAFKYPKFVNASLEFNVESLTPTYRLVQGLPGRSSAIEIARRLGMAPDILDSAVEFVHSDDRQLEHIFADLQKIQSQLTTELTQAEERHRHAEKASAEAQELLTHLQSSQQQEIKKMKRQLAVNLARARTEIRAILDEVKRDPSSQKGKEAKHRLVTIQENVESHLETESRPIPIEHVGQGDMVEISNLGTTGVLLENPQGKKRVRVRVGERELSVSVSMLAGKDPTTEELQPKVSKPDSFSQRQKHYLKGNLQESESLQQSHMRRGFGHTLDVRGVSVDDALTKTLEALDHATLTGVISLCVIHGHGLGKLKSAIREFLSTSPYVEGFRSGEPREGGDGVTIVDLR